MIAVDAMGGDYAPHEIIKGVILAARKGVSVCLFGPDLFIRSELDNIDVLWKTYPITLFDASEFITMDEEPVSAVQKKRKSSLVAAVISVKKGQCSAVVSAGNSGALMISSIFHLGRSVGCSRPAIAGFLPTIHGKALALDLGANTECRPEHLYQFAHLGSVYAKNSLGIARPRVALLSNGHEDGKGSQLTKDAYKLLKDSSINFIGNVEPYGVFASKADVVVCDGFSGNILLKTMEATYQLFAKAMKDKLSSAKNAIGLREWGEAFLDDMAGKIDNRKQGGAILLGVKGVVIVCHGSASSHVIEKAILFASKQSKDICLSSKKTSKKCTLSQAKW